MDDSNPTPTTRMDTPGTTPPLQPVSSAAAPSTAAPPPPAAAAPAAPPPPAPAWEPTRRHDGGGRWAGVIAGLILLGLGLWFFADRTLGLDMPNIRWSQLWPLILILVGAVILVGAFRRERR